MLFPTAVFTLFFLVVLAVWWSLPAQAPRARGWVLLLANLAFYSWLDPRWAGALLVLATGAWAGSFWIAQSNPGQRRARGWTTVVGLLAALVVLKYVPWAAGLQNSMAGQWGWTPWTLPEWAYPAGLSFFTFHALAIVVGVWHGRLDAPRWLPAAAHISFFPTLMAGPVLRGDAVAPRLAQPFVWQDVAWGEGVARFLVGMTFKWVLATQAASWADPVFQGVVDGRASTWWGVHAYSLQIFFDFAGYSLMALGVALLLGFRLPENFTSPYTATSLKGFWQRWHRSLSFFFRDHLYIDTFGGNARGPLVAAVAAAATMLASGLWHGASLMFLVWGAWHAGGLILERILPARDRWPAWLGWLVTFEFATWGWVWFRADTWDTALALWTQAWGSTAITTQAMAFTPLAWTWAIVMALVVASEPRWLPKVLDYSRRWDTTPVHWAQQTATLALVGVWSWCLMALGPEGVPNFIYNGF